MTATEKDSAPALPATTGRVLDVQIIDPPRAPGDMTDAEIGAAAAAAVDRSLQARADTVEQALRAGELLAAAKHRCREQGRSWSDWCRRYWTKSRTTAETYIKVANEVNPGLSGRRADDVSKLLTLSSVRALLVDTGHSPGGTRALPEPDGLREPGADEDEEPDNTPTGDMKAPTPAEAAVVDRLATQQAQSDAARADRNKRRDGRRDSRPTNPAPALTEEEKAAARAKAAEDRARHERDLAAINAARDREPGPETPAAESEAEQPVSKGSVLRDIADDLQDIARRIGLVSSALVGVKFDPVEEFDLASGKSDPRPDDMRAIFGVLGKALHVAADASTKAAPKVRALAALDDRVIGTELERIEAQKHVDAEAAARIERMKRGA